MPHFPNIFLIQYIYSILYQENGAQLIKAFISQRSMSNGFIQVVDTHFIDNIERKKILDPSACGQRLVSHYSQFLDAIQLLTQKLLKQGYVVSKLNPWYKNSTPTVITKDCLIVTKYLYLKYGNEYSLLCRCFLSFVTDNTFTRLNYD